MKQTNDGLAVILTPEQHRQLDHLNKVESEFLAIATRVSKDYAELRTSFREMVIFAHANKIAPERVTMLLAAAGFVAPRISEFKAIAYADPETYSSYVDGKIGFKPAVEKAREEKAKGKKTKRSKNAKLIAGIAKAFEKYVLANPEFKPWALQKGNAVLALGITPIDYDATTPGGVAVHIRSSGKPVTSKP